MSVLAVLGHSQGDMAGFHRLGVGWGMGTQEHGIVEPRLLEGKEGTPTPIVGKLP